MRTVAIILPPAEPPLNGPAGHSAWAQHLGGIVTTDPSNGKENLMRRRITVLSLIGALAFGVFAQVVGGDVGASASVDPANFTTPKANPYFPLRPGRMYVYRGSEDGQRLLEHLTVTSKTKTIEGVATTVIHDVLWANGRINERTHDWYAAANDGTVWYFGEATATYDRH